MIFPIKTSKAADDDKPDPFKTLDEVYASNPFTSYPAALNFAATPLIRAFA